MEWTIETREDESGAVQAFLVNGDNAFLLGPRTGDNFPPAPTTHDEAAARVAEAVSFLFVESFAPPPVG